MKGTQNGLLLINISTYGSRVNEQSSGENMQLPRRNSSSVEHKENVSNYFKRYPIRSLWRAETIYQYCATSLNVHCEKRIHMSPCKLSVAQRLKHVDYESLNCINWCLQHWDRVHLSFITLLSQTSAYFI